MLLAATRACAPETEDTPAPVDDESGYVSEDVLMRTAQAEWVLFSREADSTIAAAEEDICENTDRLYEQRTRHKFELEIALIKAESILEQLKEKWQYAKRLRARQHHYGAEAIQKMNSFKKDFRKHAQRLDAALKHLREKRFDSRPSQGKPGGATKSTSS
ncbi:hypothetical protein CHU92_07070 [Flavobacterium cyanobacteriorum]|uniref:Uncharacterized protein n=2 Tax=Flavobacterium cyanobacteriorum TaxID=2022802 RepID=A0A255Z8V8_9FLAO|nr:hypothetical protein CHU92_07070 [Flavobacterium cyanobacteriorum]